ncbi:MAG: nuclear transport factor 2 family protein [Clostridium sp.]|uniref:nuclear transport factor 2 family protein n=1 Tax=Clostridium sp. TaxID=1506 RepID=UPI0025BB38F8|nr:nuclear transport factor 2 family protein [Clostridium sp.]MCH3965439.1 nuclear transport factor 2 family protein [Clostridium sp.]MCI1717280.1 nuclear transport factor 2 family protein [Clostridium sp.]MCI1801620.1 nuclear transport factor 2 family protein [Clostridium sp.]MCI1815466.1 nuclear transport factor 2 family protein [Clostridium sp.]MCI1872369.1 nuclear transport factor 2 family protein [Clostridium sp.]
MTNNKFQLPKPIETHFQATNTGDSVTFLSTFAEDAVVIDEGREYRGKTAIKEWSDRDYFGDHLMLEVTNAVQDAEEIVVTAKSDGDYDKTGLPDPLYLDFHFTVKGDKVTRLRIVLSSNGRSIPLPQPIAAFYHASDVYDDTLLAGCFAADVVLVDEAKEYHGPEAVSGHILEANKGAQVMTEITGCVEKNGETVVTATLSGSFEGSPIPLDFHFALESGKIKALNIVLAGE